MSTEEKLSGQESMEMEDLLKKDVDICRNPEGEDGSDAPDMETVTETPEETDAAEGGDVPEADEPEVNEPEADGPETAEAEPDEEETDGASTEEDKVEEKAEEKAGKGGFFGRREKKALLKKEAELIELKDRYMRTLAEYENFRKRTEKEKSDLYAYAVKDVIGKLLPVLDNLERGLAMIPEESREDPVAQGMDKTCKQFLKALEDIGVKPINAAGEPFDPNLHNAVMHVEDESLGDNVVAEELLKGYTYKDGVVRYSMVKVAN